MDKQPGDVISRTTATRTVFNYIRTNNLTDPTNYNTIFPDKTLSILLKITDKDTLTFSNLQKYLSPHFVKKKKLQRTLKIKCTKEIGWTYGTPNHTRPPLLELVKKCFGTEPAIISVAHHNSWKNK